MMTLHPTKYVMKSGVGRFDTYFILRVVSDGRTLQLSVRHGYFIQRCESGGFDTDIYDKILSGKTNNLEVEIR